MGTVVTTVEYKSEKTSPKAIMIALDKFQSPTGPIPKIQLNLVSNMAAMSRGVLLDKFTHRSGSNSLFYNNPQWLTRHGLFKPRRSGEMKQRNNIGFIDRRGRALIGFSLEGSSKSLRRKSAHVHSYPMNLWEHDQSGGMGYKGKWIMTVQLPPIVASRAKKYTDRAEKQLENSAKELGIGKN
nr:hypothetical protein [uncultured Sphaerochaeta sp.]